MRAEQFTAEIAEEIHHATMNVAAKNGAATHVKPTRQWVTLMDDIAETEIDWAWTNRIPRGALTEFLGDPAVGKSHAYQAIAADLSNGRALPFDKEPEAPLRTLILSFEESAESVIKPHLRKLGADMRLIGIPNKENKILPSQFNVNILEHIYREFPAALIVIDPVLPLLSRKNTDRASDVRDVLAPLADFAERRNVAIILIRHLNKSTQNRAIYRGQGSIDFNAIVRSSFIFGENPGDPEWRTMVQLKNSHGRLAPSLDYHIDDDGVFHWGAESTVTADEALGTGEPKKQRETERLDGAKAFLEKILADGSAASNSIREKAKDAGIAWRTVWRAKEALAIKASKCRETGEWFWRLA